MAEVSIRSIYTFLEYVNFLGIKYICIEIYMRSYIRNDYKIDPRIRVCGPGTSSETLAAFEAIKLKMVEDEGRGPPKRHYQPPSLICPHSEMDLDTHWTRKMVIGSAMAVYRVNIKVDGILQRLALPGEVRWSGRVTAFLLRHSGVFAPHTPPLSDHKGSVIKTGTFPWILTTPWTQHSQSTTILSYDTSTYHFDCFFLCCYTGMSPSVAVSADFLSEIIGGVSHGKRPTYSILRVPVTASWF
jgi:hypothetical protein